MEAVRAGEMGPADLRLGRALAHQAWIAHGNSHAPALMVGEKAAVLLRPA